MRRFARCVSSPRRLLLLRVPVLAEVERHETAYPTTPPNRAPIGIPMSIVLRPMPPSAPLVLLLSPPLPTGSDIMTIPATRAGSAPITTPSATLPFLEHDGGFSSARAAELKKHENSRIVEMDSLFIERPPVIKSPLADRPPGPHPGGRSSSPPGLL